MEDSRKKIWDAVLRDIEQKISRSTFERWFAETSLERSGEESLTVRVPNPIHQLWIESNYADVLADSVNAVLRVAMPVTFVCEEESPGEPVAEEAQAAEPAGTVERKAPRGGNGVSGRAVAEVAPSAQTDAQQDLFGSVPGADRELTKAVLKAGVNPRHSFQSFVVGPSNHFAQAACLAVGKAPGRTYNPLFIHGGSGLGKTHLMHAVGQMMLADRVDARIVYVTSEHFTNKFIHAVMNNALVAFRNRFRKADVLLIDDVHFFAGKESTQEEFFHTFNRLMDSHRQIVLTSDRPPSELSGLEKRLVSRFEWGMLAGLSPPEIETRIAIVRKKLQAISAKLSDEIIQFIADRITTNVRRLEGAIMRLASYSTLSGEPLTLEAASRHVADLLQDETKTMVTIEGVQREVSNTFDIRVADMTSKRRPASIAFPRQIAMFLCRSMTKASLKEIGEAFNRDHGTVIHAVKRVTRELEKDESLQARIDLIENRLREAHRE